MKIRYIAAILLMLFTTLIARAELKGNFPGLSERVPHFMERLQSNRWQVRYGLLHDLTGRDVETKHVLEMLIRDENKSVANQALMRYLRAFVDIDKTLFKPELYFGGIVGCPPEPDLLKEERYDALVDIYLRGLKAAKLGDPGMHYNLTIVGIMGKPGDAETLYPFLKSANDYIVLGAAKAVIRLGDKKKGMEALRSITIKEPSKHLSYITQSLYALKEMRHPELETIVNDVLSSINQSEGIQPNWLNEFFLLAADVTSKDVWNVEEPSKKPDAGNIEYKDPLELVALLSNPNEETRAVAAAAMRQIIAADLGAKTVDHGEEYWKKRVESVTTGMKHSEVLRLLPAYDTTLSAEQLLWSGVGSGQTHIAMWRLDHYWTVTILYRNPDTVIKCPKLQNEAMRFWVEPPVNFTGTWVTWHVNGQKSHEIEYNNGKYHGLFGAFYDNGQKCYQQHFKDGVCSGSDSGWYPDGSKMYHGNYTDGKQTGTWTHWDDDGNVSTVEHKN